MSLVPKPPSSQDLPLSDALTGRTLAQPVQDAQGNTLLAAGAVLSENAIRSLMRREIETVHVLAESADAPDNPATLEARREAIKRQVEFRFRHSQLPDQINPLLLLVLRYRLEDLS